MHGNTTPQQLSTFAARQRLTEIVTLSDRALTVLKESELFRRLYTFCDNSHVQILPHANDRADDAGVVGI
jgi:hypothetical protein